MKNSDMPAMPNGLDPQSAGAMPEFDHSVTVDGLARWQCGMTKREYFAGLAMQALLSATDEGGTWMGLDCASQAVIEADALLAELEKQS